MNELSVIAHVMNSRAFRFGWKKFDSIRFDSIHAGESIFRFDSIRQFDKMDACIGVMIFLSIAEFLFSNQ